MALNHILGTLSAVLLLGAMGASGARAEIRIPLISGPSHVIHHKMKLSDWRLSIMRSRFSGELVCQLRAKNKKVVFVADAVGFTLGVHKNTLDAWVRLDSNLPYRWRDDLPELSRLDVAIDGRNLDAPTDGIVWLPSSKLETVHRVAIQLNPRKKPRVFHLRGFTGLREIARSQGCTPDVRFVR
jgi:hypothetical protein